MKPVGINKFMRGLLALCALIGLMAVSGCDPEKVGGGGLLQSYDASTGRYN